MPQSIWDPDGTYTPPGTPTVAGFAAEIMLIVGVGAAVVLILRKRK